MRITQGTFSFLPDLTDEQIAAQVLYALEHDWVMSIEYTDDPHPRNNYWEMWGLPQFDLSTGDVDVVMRDMRACREAHPNHYIKVIAYDATLGRQTSAISFIVNALGLGVGPALVPFLNEHLFHDPNQLRCSLIIVVFSSAAIAVTLLLIERPAFRQKQLAAAAWQ